MTLNNWITSYSERTKREEKIGRVRNKFHSSKKIKNKNGKHDAKIYKIRVTNQKNQRKKKINIKLKN